MIPFDFQPQTRIVFGAHRLETLGELVTEQGAARALVVTDPGVVQAGHTERGLNSLQQAGIETALFSAVHENPTTVDVDAAVRLAEQHQPDVLIGLGGGSAMDCAKGCNFVFSNGGRMQDYWGVGKATRPMLPMIAVPTTAGTGSEAQSFALISDAETKVKMACGDKKAACRLALLDPCLTVTQPRRVTALTGIDAIAHALETYVTKPRNPASLAFSREAWHLLSGNFARVLRDPEDLEARSGMQFGACFAGLAIENSMLGATHALANPLTARYGIVHGEAIGIMLPYVIQFNAEQVGDWYRDLMEVTVGPDGAPPATPNAAGLVDMVREMVGQAELATRLAERGVESEQLSELAAATAQQWTGTFNPRDVTETDLLELYRLAF